MINPILRLTSPRGTALTINLEEKTISASPIGTIKYKSIFGRTRHEGKIVGYVEANKSMIIYSDDPSEVSRIFTAYENSKLESLVPGVLALKSAINKETRYRESFSAAMGDENNDGVDMPSVPNVSAQAISEQYPVAALYLKADSYADASNYMKSSAGKKAREMIKDGLIIEAKEVMRSWNKDSFID